MPRPDDARATFPRSRRLKRRRLIRALFDRSRDDVTSVRAGALLVRYRVVERDEVGQSVPLQVGFATGRHLRVKPERNRVKRAMREVFRVHQHALVDLFADRPDTLTMMVLYRGKPAGARVAIAQHLPVLLDRVVHDFLPAPSADA